MNEQLESLAEHSDNDDVAKMSLAFEAFMLTGRATYADGENCHTGSAVASQLESQSKKKKKKKKRPSTEASVGGMISKQSSKSTPQKESPNKSHLSRRKRYYQLFRSFSDKIKHSWMEIDDQMVSVLENVVSIRERLPFEWNLLHSTELKNEGEYGDNSERSNRSDDWKYFGFEGKPKEHSYSFHLHLSDIRLALNHDLEQHEKMIVALRTLMSDLAESHDSLGRVVDKIWQFHLDGQLEVERDESNNGEEDDNAEIDLFVKNATHLFHVLSTELYRKQCLIPVVIESANDDMLGANTKSPLNLVAESKDNARMSKKSSEDSPLELARDCYKAWQRNIDQRLIGYWK